MAEGNSSDLWPDFDTNMKIRTPVAILREQAAILGAKTKNIVEGFVTTNQLKEGFEHGFYLRAPGLGGYVYNLFAIRHGVIALWPVTLHWSSRAIECENEPGLMIMLAEVFKHPDTVKVVHSIIAQSTS